MQWCGITTKCLIPDHTSVVIQHTDPRALQDYRQHECHSVDPSWWMLGIATVKRIFSNQHQSSGVCRGAASLSVAQYLETQQLSAAWSWWAAFKKEQCKSLSKSCSSACTEYYHLVTGLWVCHFYLPLSMKTPTSHSVAGAGHLSCTMIWPPLFISTEPVHQNSALPKLWKYAPVSSGFISPPYSISSKDSKSVSIFENKTVWEDIR